MVTTPARTGMAPINKKAVINQLQQVSGMRIRDMPLARISRVVVMKFNAPIRDAPQNRAMLTIHKSSPSPSPGPAAGMALKVG